LSIWSSWRCNLKTKPVRTDASEQGGDSAQAQGKGQPWAYKILVHLERDRLEVNGERHQLASGMQVAVEIHLSPVSKVFHESGRER
jgi:hypothetical protein